MAKRSGYTKRDVKQINFTIGQNLAAARRNAGMTQTDVMKAIWGVSNNRNRISEIENGKKNLTLIDLLIFQDLYGQSLDYICGLSIEPEIDILAGTVNHVVNQSHTIIEMLTTELASVVVDHIKSICANDHEALLTRTKELCDAIKDDQCTGGVSEPVAQATREVMHVIRKIEVDQARKVNAVDMQMMQIKERINNEDKHYLLRDRNKNYQYSMPLLKPEMIDDTEMVGVDDE